MTREDVKRIFRLIRAYWPRALQDSDARLAWSAVLEKFTYDDVKASVLEYAAKNEWPPKTVGVLTKGLTPEETQHSLAHTELTYDAAYGNICVYADFFDRPRPAYGDDLAAWCTENVRKTWQ